MVPHAETILPHIMPLHALHYPETMNINLTMKPMHNLIPGLLLPFHFNVAQKNQGDKVTCNEAHG